MSVSYNLHFAASGYARVTHPTEGRVHISSPRNTHAHVYTLIHMHARTHKRRGGEGGARREVNIQYQYLEGRQSILS